MEGLLGLLKQLWTVWLVLLFLGICAWAFWPSRRKEMERHARIPLEDETPPPADRNAPLKDENGNVHKG